MAIRKRARANVVSLRGATIPGTREADADVVSCLERLLNDARHGVVHGIAYVTVCDENMGTGWAGKADSHRMLAGAALLSYRMAHGVDGE